MKSQKSARRHRREPTAPLSPRLLRQMVDDLKKRLQERERDAAALPALVETHGAGEMPYGVYCLYRALGLALTTHAAGMRDLLGFAELLADRANGRAAR